MSNSKEIRMKIGSIRNIQKIAKSMEMIAVSKLHKAKQRLLSSQSYIDAIRHIIYNMSLGQLEYKHPYFIKRNIKSVGYWVISTDRGLSGGLNINLFRTLLSDISRWNKIGVFVKLSIFGSKAISFFKSYTQCEIISCISGLGDSPEILDLIGLTRVMSQLYFEEKIDRLYIIYNNFINTLSQVSKIVQVLPIVPINNFLLKSKNWDYLYEPDSQFLLNILLQRYIESEVYQGILENLLSEQSARMIAMKTASDNGECLINDLKLLSNKIRQSRITQELTEIISGASVV